MPIGMRPRTELALAAGVAAALLLLAFVGGARARGAEDPDRRASSFVTGREGVRALADVAERVGVEPVRWRQRPQALAAWLDARVPGAARDDSTNASVVDSTPATVVVLAPAERISPAERRVLARLTMRPIGVDLVVADDALAQCFGYAVVGSALDSSRVAPPGLEPDSSAAFVHDHLVPIGELPQAVRARLADEPTEGAGDGLESDEDEDCQSPRVLRTDTLLLTTAGKLAMVRLTVWPGRRRVLLLGDAALLRNRTLREASTAPLVVDAVLPDTGVLVFDEYHQGFGEGGSMAGVVLAWSRRHPMGWAAWQLALVGLVALLAGAVRFGPVRAAIPRTRRSPLEHVRALATALSAANGRGVAIGAMVRGLRRRLAPAAVHASPHDDWRPWLAALAERAPNARVRASAERLSQLADHPDSETAVLSAANAVEDLWVSLRP